VLHHQSAGHQFITQAAGAGDVVLILPAQQVLVETAAAARVEVPQVLLERQTREVEVEAREMLYLQ